MCIGTPVLIHLLMPQKSETSLALPFVHMHLSCPVKCLVQRKSSAVSRKLAGCLQSKLAQGLPLEKLPYSFTIRTFKKSFRSRFPQGETPSLQCSLRQQPPCSFIKETTAVLSLLTMLSFLLSSCLCTR